MGMPPIVKRKKSYHSILPQVLSMCTHTKYFANSSCTSSEIVKFIQVMYEADGSSTNGDNRTET